MGNYSFGELGGFQKRTYRVFPAQAGIQNQSSLMLGLFVSRERLKESHMNKVPASFPRRRESMAKIFRDVLSSSEIRYDYGS